MSKKDVLFGFLTVLILLLLFLSAIFWMLYTIQQYPNISVSDGFVTIDGYYNKKINLDGATAYLSDEKIVIDATYSGQGGGNLKKGNYMIKGSDEPVYLNLIKSDETYIKIIDSSKKVYMINRQSYEETLHLFENISVYLDNC